MLKRTTQRTQSGYSKLAHNNKPPVHSSARLPDYIKSDDRRIAVSCFREIQALSSREFTLDAAANDSGNKAMCTEFCSPSNSFMSKQHSGNIWLNAPFAKLVDFPQHYAVCKEQQPDLSACILVPSFLLPALRPYLKGMSLLKHYRKGTAVFDAPTKSGQRQSPGVLWPVFIHTDCSAAVVSQTDAQQARHKLHGAVVATSQAEPAKPADAQLSMLFEGSSMGLKLQTLLDSGATDNFVSAATVQRLKLQTRSAAVNLQLADGSATKISSQVKLRMTVGSLHTSVSCFVTDLGEPFDVILGNSFLVQHSAVMCYESGTCVLITNSKQFIIHSLHRPAACSGQSGTNDISKSILSVAQARRDLRAGCRSFTVMVSAVGQLDAVNTQADPNLDTEIAQLLAE